MNNIDFIKTVVFFTMVIILILLEFFLPRKQRVRSRKDRWPGNLLIILINRIITPLFLMVPLLTMDRPFSGLFIVLKLPQGLSVILGIIILDLVIYLQHRLFHKCTPFWAIHKMHHTDRDLDFTSALRFHPLELFASMFFKLFAIWIFGIELNTLLIFEVAINSFAIFNHGNFYINEKIDRVLRLFIITPDLHRIHHSVLYNECNSNYGTIFTLWDYLFMSLNLSAKKGQDGMVIGLPGFKNPRFQSIHWMLVTPFIKKGDSHV